MQKKATKLTGRGDYMTKTQAADLIKGAMKKAVAKGLRSGGAAVGRRAGALLGNPSGGAKLGKSLAAKMSRLIGSGDYETNAGAVMANSLFKGSGASENSTFSSGAHGEIRLRHREYIQDIFAGTASQTGAIFSNSSFQVNPGLTSTFPYLAQIAANFEQYRFEGLVFEFVSSTAPYGVTAMGTIVMAAEYNAQAPPYVSKTQMENSDYAISMRPDKSGLYGLECAPGSSAQQYYYVRAPGSTTPANLTDMALMQVAVNTTVVASGSAGIVAGSSLGELWVTYDVILARPRISPARYGYAHFRRFQQTAGEILGVPSTTSESVTYGALTGMTVSNTTLTFPNASIGDVYQILFTWSGVSATSSVAYPTTALTNLANFNIINGNTTAFATSNPLPALGSVLSYTVYVQVTAEQPTIPTMVLSGGSYPTTCKIDIVITDLGNGLVAGTTA